MRSVAAAVCRLLCWNCVVLIHQAPASWAQSSQQWAEMRQQMVLHEVSGAGVRDPRVIRAIQKTPRHLFVPSRHRRLAYTDMALPIGEGQTISPPFIVAYMTEQLNPHPTDKVLEIGTGSGYQAAVLSPLVGEVYTIEIVKPLAQRASAVLKKLHYHNIKTKAGDGFGGWPEYAPYDKIIVTCSPEEIPQALVDQLNEGGRLVIPLGERFQQSLCLYVKLDGKLKRQELEATFFVPMTGQAEVLRKKTSDEALTELINGDFERINDRQEPVGWYYIRQAEAIASTSAPMGEKVLRITNRDRGRHAQVLQALGLDGRRVTQVEVRYWVRTQSVMQGQSKKQVPKMRLSFYDKKRAEVKTHQLGPWQGTTDWKQVKTTIDVPKKTRLAVLMIGMFGAVGKVELDAIAMEARTR